MKTSLPAFALVLVVAAISAGCSTPYKAYGSLGGYTDQKLGPNRYLIKFVGNGFTSPETVQQHWSRRASELCEGKPFKSDAQAGIETQRGIIVNSSGAFGNTERFPMMQGTVECQS